MNISTGATQELKVPEGLKFNPSGTFNSGTFNYSFIFGTDGFKLQQAFTKPTRSTLSLCPKHLAPH